LIAKPGLGVERVGAVCFTANDGGRHGGDAPLMLSAATVGVMKSFLESRGLFITHPSAVVDEEMRIGAQPSRTRVLLPRQRQVNAT